MAGLYSNFTTTWERSGNNRKVEITHTLKVMVHKERKVNTGKKKKDFVTADFHPPPRLVLRGMFFA